MIECEKVRFWKKEDVYFKALSQVWPQNPHTWSPVTQRRIRVGTHMENAWRIVKRIKRDSFRRDIADKA
jgi:hypothetical protein